MAGGARCHSTSRPIYTERRNRHYNHNSTRFMKALPYAVLTRHLLATSFYHPEKMTQLLGVVAEFNGGSISHRRALLIIYFADRYHFRRWRRPVAGDEYLATTNGPVPKHLQTFLRTKILFDEQEHVYRKKYLQISSRYYRSVQKPETECLSESDMEALQWAWRRFKAMSVPEMERYSKRYPEWRRRERLMQRKRQPIPMSYLDFAEESTVPDTEPCYVMSDERRVAFIARMQEYMSIESIFSGRGKTPAAWSAHSCRWIGHLGVARRLQTKVATVPESYMEYFVACAQNHLDRLLSKIKTYLITAEAVEKRFGITAGELNRARESERVIACQLSGSRRFLYLSVQFENKVIHKWAEELIKALGIGGTLHYILTPRKTLDGTCYVEALADPKTKNVASEMMREVKRLVR